MHSSQNRRHYLYIQVITPRIKLIFVVIVDYIYIYAPWNHIFENKNGYNLISYYFLTIKLVICSYDPVDNAILCVYYITLRMYKICDKAFIGYRVTSLSTGARWRVLLYRGKQTCFIIFRFLWIQSTQFFSQFRYYNR